ncbi:predicted protein [Nematostella vectensis]|uniref:Carbohydrate sulfotransferase n=1 Tax=Nematostella vectensis TaxID=45351 RepID=A7RUA7_NEMVE|nr:predicted protein [Nematostella vectensis]|eukprot:XP_001637045.1 predicted protein [Nematostella vectensis]
MLPRGTKDLQVHPYMFRNIIVNDKHNLLYCYIPKVACSNWKRVLMVLNGDTTDPYTINTADVHNRSLGYFRYLNEYSPTEIVHRLKNYYKFLFVRHPYERLVSAYRNKFIDSYNYTLFKQLYGRRIIKHFRRNPDQRSLKTGEGVSFTEFVSYLLASDSEFSDRHWQQYDLLCRPCLIYYDYVGKFENLRSDADDLLRLLGVEDRVQFPHNMSSGYKTSSSHLAKQYFRQLPLELKDRLRKLYKHDLNMFGYSAEDFE